LPGSIRPPVRKQFNVEASTPAGPVHAVLKFEGRISGIYSVFHTNEQEKIGFSTQRFKGTKVQRPICRELFEPLSL
jgi:hypothetical protein